MKCKAREKKLTQWLTVGQRVLSDSPEVSVFAGLILVGATLAYLVWFRPQTIRLQKALDALSKALEISHDGWATAKEQARSVLKGNPAIKTAWQETEDRVIPLMHGNKMLFVMFGAPRDVWSTKRLLGRSINLPLAEAIPNLLVGIGLLFTFFFLTLALTQATAALLPQAGQAPTDITAATRGLLSAAGAKFLTSLAGLLASLIWAVAARRRMARLNTAAEEVLEHLGRIVPSGGGEMAVFSQLQIARDHYQSSGEHVVITKDLAAQSNHQIKLSVDHIEVTKSLEDKAAQKLDLAAHLLTEAREQTGTFKRFETDLAVTLGGAITQAFSPQMETMTNRLIGAIDSLSDKIGTMNQEALQQMMKDFGSMLKETTNAEMSQLKETLETLVTRLDGSGQAIGTGADRMAASLDKAGTDLLTRVEQISTNLALGATNLEGATQGVKEAMNDLDITIVQAADLGKQGAVFVREALETSATVFGRLNSVSQELNLAGDSLERVSGQIANTVDSIEEMTKEQRAVVTAVRDATPQALESVQRVLDLLQKTVQLTASMMSQTKDSMTTTSKTLGTTVAEITTGISEYSMMVADLHRRMDNELAKAIGSLDKGVVGLDEAIEELAEVLISRPRGG